MRTRRLTIVSLIGALLWSGMGWAQQPKYGGTLHIAMPGDMTFFNAHQGPAPGVNTFWVSNNIFNSLLSMTPPPELKIIPELAKSWEVLDEGRTYIFHLEEGVKFHDGTNFDAKAAKWNFDRILDPEVNSWVATYYEDVAEVAVVDQHTLRVEMKAPSAVLPIALGAYFQGIPMASPKAFETYGKDWVRHPTGTGPYKLKEWIPGQRVILEKNAGYFKRGLPYIDTLEFRIMSNSLAATIALLTGEIDFITRVPVPRMLVLERSTDIKVVAGLGTAPTVAFLNMRVKPFDDVRARRAVGGYGIDRVEVANVAFLGRARPLVSVLAPGVQGAMDLTDMYPYRPDKAMRLLKELGFDESNPLRFTILVGNQDPTMVDVATLLKSQMAKIGVETKISLMDAVSVSERVLVKHDFEMVVSSWANLFDINQRSVSFFMGTASDYMGINDANLEGLVRRWRRTLDVQGRDKLSAEMQHLIATQLYWVNVTTYPFFQAHRTHVKNYPFYNQAYLLLEQVWLDQ